MKIIRPSHVLGLVSTTWEGGGGAVEKIVTCYKLNNLQCQWKTIKLVNICAWVTHSTETQMATNTR